MTQGRTHACVKSTMNRLLLKPGSFPMLVPVLELLGSNESDKQRQAGKQALLDVQGRDTQLSETLSVHTGNSLHRSGCSIL